MATTQNILTSLDKLIDQVKKALNESTDADLVKETANKMIAQLELKQTALKKLNEKSSQYAPFKSSDFLHEILEIVEEHSTDLQAAPGFWNKVAYYINEFFGKELCAVDKTQFSNLEHSQAIKDYKSELQDMKKSADFDSVCQTFGI